MKLIDTHAHLQFQAYDADRDEVVKRNSKELEAIVNVGASLDSSNKGVELSSKVENFFAAVGVHPHHVDQWSSEALTGLEKLIKQRKVVAIGEIGLDNHLYAGYPTPDLKAQGKILREQINLAIENDKPVLFHCRDAYDELYEEIKNYKDLTGLVHCFMGTPKQVKKFLGLGLYISFSGNVTYKGNDYIRESAGEVPLERILVETDSPYLPPEPHRGSRNEPYRVKITAERVARLKSLDLAEVAEATSTNANNLLNLWTA